MEKKDLQPKCVFEHFARINEIPRPSKREEKMIEYLRNWGESHNLETNVDETGNVIIRKPATKGMENRKTVILQTLEMRKDFTDELFNEYERMENNG